jgi:hypothetical protein
VNIEVVIETAYEVFGDEYPVYRDVPLPLSKNNITALPAIWTRDGLRPRWGNLALVATEVTQKRPQEWWEREKERHTIPATILVNANKFILLETFQGDARITDITDTLLPQLQRLRRELFSPKSLSKFTSGQLSFADIEDKWTGGFAQHMQRQQRRLDEALAAAVKKALSEQGVKSQNSIDTIFAVSLAYMSARILEDKGYFGSARPDENDPVELLTRTREKTDGFFTHAQNVIYQLSDTVHQALASELGKVVSFALIDHRDVGRLYEQALKITLQWKQEEQARNRGNHSEAKGTDSMLSSLFPISEGHGFLELQQYYTPVALASQILAHLPLERIPPHKRVIYDPAAGSGSLLLAASHRLSQMQDVAISSNLTEFLANYVLANDKDPNAQLLTKLRYLLIQEAFGQSLNLLPDPKYFSPHDYRDEIAWNSLPKRPTVVVANPPFYEEGAVQWAAQFVTSVLPRLEYGNQFAFILPRSFLTATTHGWEDAQKAVGNNCQILDIWQLSQGIVGISADVDVCAILGIVGTPPSSNHAISRSMLSSKKRVKKATIEDGFLGHARLQSTDNGADLRAFTAPKIEFSVPTVRLGDLYSIYNGVLPFQGCEPLSEEVYLKDFEGKKVKRYWQHRWRRTGSLWADPKQIPSAQEYIVYDKSYLERMREKAESVFDSPKVLVSRSTNFLANDPLPAYLDTEGLCPNNDVYSLVPLEKALSGLQPTNWQGLSDYDKFLWLVGLLNSSVVRTFSKYGRSSRHLNKWHLKNLPLPAQVEKEIIEKTAYIIDLERGIREDGDIDAVKKDLDALVQKSYGNPYIPPPIDYEDILHEWVEEQEKEQFFTATGQVLGIDYQQMQIHLYLDNLDDEVEDAWISLPRICLPGP